MRINSHIYDVKFRYPTKFGRYISSRRDIPALVTVRKPVFRKFLKNEFWERNHER